MSLISVYPFLYGFTCSGSVRINNDPASIADFIYDYGRFEDKFLITTPVDEELMEARGTDILCNDSEFMTIIAPLLNHKLAAGRDDRQYAPIFSIVSIVSSDHEHKLLARESPEKLEDLYEIPDFELYMAYEDDSQVFTTIIETYQFGTGDGQPATVDQLEDIKIHLRQKGKTMEQLLAEATPMGNRELRFHWTDKAYSNPGQYIKPACLPSATNPLTQQIVDPVFIVTKSDEYQLHPIDFKSEMMKIAENRGFTVNFGLNAHELKYHLEHNEYDGYGVICVQKMEDFYMFRVLCGTPGYIMNAHAHSNAAAHSGDIDSILMYLGQQPVCQQTMPNELNIQL